MSPRALKLPEDGNEPLAFPGRGGTRNLKTHSFPAVRPSHSERKAGRVLRQRDNYFTHEGLCSPHPHPGPCLHLSPPPRAELSASVSHPCAMTTLHTGWNQTHYQELCELSVPGRPACVELGRISAHLTDMDFTYTRYGSRTCCPRERVKTEGMS